MALTDIVSPQDKPNLIEMSDFIFQRGKPVVWDSVIYS